MAKQQHTPATGQITQGFNCRFGTTLDRLSGRKHCRVRPGRQLGDTIEIAGNADYLRSGQSLSQRGLKHVLGVADQQDSLGHSLINSLAFAGGNTGLLLQQGSQLVGRQYRLANRQIAIRHLRPRIISVSFHWTHNRLGRGR